VTVVVTSGLVLIIVLAVIDIPSAASFGVSVVTILLGVFDDDTAGTGCTILTVIILLKNAKITVTLSHELVGRTLQ